LSLLLDLLAPSVRLTSYFQLLRKAGVMRLPWLGPTREEITSVTHDLIVRYGLFAHDEAVHLAEVARFLGSAKNGRLYRLAADEIKLSFDMAWRKISQKHAPEPSDYLSKLNNQSTYINARPPQLARQPGSGAIP
jgi:hypothetical protein